MKKIVALLAIVALFIGGCNMMNKKETLTKEQQDNVVKWISRGYDVNVVEFLQLSKNNSTGIYLLSIRLNEDTTLETTIPTDSLSEFNNMYGTVGLNPRGKFQYLERSEWFLKDSDVNISKIVVHYLEN
ncbi:MULTISPECIES: hypothetical protein [unclassified Granulicatella]|uniref:hypothetical protein n=1 Tax=unclassified Granulicatella TaxID=2630493 RepID=UPI001D15F9DD|nr:MULTISPECIES: hypothetical protein [unclassified Granulicatella]